MWGKKFSTSNEWSPEEGVKFLKDQFEERQMWASEILPLCKKGKRIQNSLEKIQEALLEIEKGILGPEDRNLFSADEKSWWRAFF